MGRLLSTQMIPIPPELDGWEAWLFKNLNNLFDNYRRDGEKDASFIRTLKLYCDELKPPPERVKAKPEEVKVATNGV